MVVALASQGVAVADGLLESLGSEWLWLLAIFGAFLAAGLGVLGVNLLILKRVGDHDSRLTRQLVTFGAGVLVVLAVIVLAPFDEETRDSLLKILGLALTAVLAFASTTFVSNAMAGLMLRSLSNFRPGDFLRVENEFGRVTERGLFHTEIQTEDRDLTTIPNLYLVTNPVKVIHASGTIVSATVSLGYDVGHGRIEEVLGEAAAAAELEEPFVQVTDLGDFSVTYRVAGFLSDVKHIVSARSHLRASMLDGLHDAGIEIVSPTFMNQRRLEASERFIPRRSGRRAGDPEVDGSTAKRPEEVMFDKAEEAGRVEELREERKGLEERIKGAKKGEGEGEDTGALKARIEEIDAEIAEREERRKNGETREASGGSGGGG